jgi:hypothetical protein
MTQPDPALEGVARDANTLTDVIASLEREGFEGQFVARDGAVVECMTCKTRTPASEMTGDHRLRRLEGPSDPADMLAVAALTCPSCGTKGTLALNYGPEASSTDDDVLRCLDVPAGEAS